MVEIVYSDSGGEEAFFDGVQLTFRFLDAAVSHLAAKGHRYEPIDIGFRFEPGFAIFSMASMSARDLDPAATEDDPRLVCEGVSVAPYDYFRPLTDEEIEAYIRSHEESR
ncbi:hypothetical protein [Dactylosporangium sp. NPDC000521]|uniref:hypothetical protein n=1 Tax=Dactylosporangium sp. NPDC000521 TaxID=3363975 RepID=UPI0036D0E6E4